MQTPLRHLRICLGALVLLAAPATAMARAASADDGVPRIGLDPGEPQAPSPTPAIPFGVQPALSREYVLDFHGYLLLPAQLGLHERPNPTAGAEQPGAPCAAAGSHEPRTTSRTPASCRTPGCSSTSSTATRPSPATVILAGTSALDAAGYYDPVAQMGVNDAYMTVNLTKRVRFPLQVNVGAYTGRYGAMGMYDAGRYGTPLIAQTNTIGEEITAAYKVGDLLLLIDQGLGGQLGRPPVGFTPAGWNDFADPNVGATFVNQVHVGVAYRPLVRLGLHYLTAWTQDDLTPGGNIPDGRITVMGADAHVTGGRAGHLYLGRGQDLGHERADGLGRHRDPERARRARADRATTSGRRAGNVNGSLTDVRRPVRSQPGAAGLRSALHRRQPRHPGQPVRRRDVRDQPRPRLQRRAQAEGRASRRRYLFLSWLGVSERFDHVRLHGSDSTQAYTSLASRLLFHTGWRSRGEIALQYTYFVYGSGVPIDAGYPPAPTLTINPDRNVFSLIGTFWW